MGEAELRRIFYNGKRWANSGFACIFKEKYRSIHESTETIRSLLMWNAVLTSCIEISILCMKIVENEL